MNLARWIKQMVPETIKHTIKEERRRRRFRAAFERYRRLPVDRDPPEEVVGELVAAWGNESFSARDEYIFTFIRQSRQTTGPILECGSGLSTLLLGVEAARRNMSVWTLEHHPDWAERVRRELQARDLSAVEYCSAPLHSYDGFAWYDPPLERMPRDFALVVCDGPPGECPGGRYGMMPIMSKHLRAGCVVLLDDYERREEQEIADRWVSETGAELEKHGEKKPYALLRLP